MLDPDEEGEKEFQQRKSQLGSLFAFHGTRQDCVYSIFRNGLRDLSNSHLMKVGAARGAGIYASPTLGVAAGYSKYTVGAGQNLPN